MSENLPHRTAATATMQASEWEGELPSRIRKAFGDAPFLFKTYLRQQFIEVAVSSVIPLLHYLHNTENFDVLTDLTAVDRPNEVERFEIIYILYSLPRNDRLRLKTRVRLDAEVPSATSIYAAANWLEREVFDMFGVRFSNHPNLKRILMPEDWDGFPLRKDKSIIAMDNDWVQRNLGIESGQS